MIPIQVNLTKHENLANDTKNKLLPYNKIFESKPWSLHHSVVLFGVWGAIFWLK